MAPLCLPGFLTRSAHRPAEKDEKEITKEIQAIIRQITASVTFLPLLDEPCTPSTPRPAPLLPCPAPSWGYFISSA